MIAVNVYSIQKRRERKVIYIQNVREDIMIEEQYTKEFIQTSMKNIKVFKEMREGKVLRK